MSEMLISRDLFTTRVNSTVMSINERFTYLRNKARAPQTSVLTIRAKNSVQQQASAKNRRLAMQMEKRLSAMAALRIKKKSIRQRLGMLNNTTAANVHDRLSLPVRGRSVRGRKGLRPTRGRSLQRSQSMQSLKGGNLQRTASIQSLNKETQGRGRSRSRSRTRNQTPGRRSRANSLNRAQQQQQQKQTPLRSSSVGRQSQKANFGRQRRFNSNSFGQQIITNSKRGKRNSIGVRNQRFGNQANKFGRNQRGARGGRRSRGNFRRTNSQPGRTQQIRGKRERGRGGRPGTRGRLGRGGQTKVILPTKEELDKQLEQYMANTKSHLDKEIDTYMKESGVNDF